ncbi:MAG: Phage tail tape measure protein [Candidatus Midichloria mitochondrii]
MSVIKLIVEGTKIAFKSGVMLKLGMDVLVEDTKKTLEENMAEKEKPNTFWAKVKGGVSKAIDIATSPTAGRIISIGSAVFTAATGGLAWPLAVAVVATTVAAAGIGVSIQAYRLRSFQRSKLELAILKELEKDPAKVKEVLDSGKFNDLKLNENSIEKNRRVSVFKVAGKEMGSSLAENTAATALSVLSADIPMLVINSITTLLNYTNNSKMRASQDKLYAVQKKESDRMKSELGLDVVSKDVEKLRELYKSATGKEFEHKTPTFGSALYETVVKGTSSKEILLQYTASHNPYISKEPSLVHTPEEKVPAKQVELQVQVKRDLDDITKEMASATETKAPTEQTEQYAYQRPVERPAAHILKEILREGPQAHTKQVPKERVRTTGNSGAAIAG